MEPFCGICMEVFDETKEISAVVPCGHTFDSRCLRRWIRRSQTCPECRANTTKKMIKNLYINFMSSSNSSDLEIANLKAQLRAKNEKLTEEQKEKVALAETANTLQEEKKIFEAKIAKLRKKKAELTKELKFCKENGYFNIKDIKDMLKEF